MNARTSIGGNNPPSALDSAAITLADIRKFGDEHPVCTSHEQAKEAKLFVDRGKLAVKEADAERDAKVRPLNETVKTINAEYKTTLDPLKAATAAVEEIGKAFIRAEEAKRQRELEAARKAAAEAEAAARAAEKAEREAIENAAQGDLDAGRVSATLDADEAFSRFQLAQRAAQVAERDAKVKVAGGFGSAMSLRTVELLEVVNIGAAAMAMARDDDLIKAVETAARRYRKEWDELPPGVISHQVRK